MFEKDILNLLPGCILITKDCLLVERMYLNTGKSIYIKNTCSLVLSKTLAGGGRLKMKLLTNNKEVYSDMHLGNFHKVFEIKNV